MWFEVFIVSIHNLPYVNYIMFAGNEERVIRYSINSIIVLFMKIRLFLIIRLLARFTKWRTD